MAKEERKLAIEALLFRIISDFVSGVYFDLEPYSLWPSKMVHRPLCVFSLPGPSLCVR